MRCLVLLCCCAVLVAVEVEFEGRKVVYYAPEDGKPSGVLLWFHDAAGHPDVDAGWFRGRGFAQRGLAIAVPPGRLQWNPEVDALFAARLARELQQRLQLDPARTVIGGAGDGAAFAMELGTRYQSAMWSAVLLARGAAGGRWKAAGEDPPRFGIYANANDPTLPIRSLRTIERRLVQDGYPVRFAAGMAEAGWGSELARLLEELCDEVAIPLGPPLPERSVAPVALDPPDEPETPRRRR